MSENINRAMAAYAAYGKTTDFKNFQGNPMPAWADLPDKIREAWVNASDAAARHHESPAVFSADQIDQQLRDANEDEPSVRENIRRLRFAAARLEAAAVASFALVFVESGQAPIYSFRVSGRGPRELCEEAGQVCMGLHDIRQAILPLWSKARIAWRNGG